MTIEFVGPWILVLVGVFMLVADAATTYRGKPPQKPWIWIVGLGACGTGVYDPTFLIPYPKFINPILAMQRSPDVATYTAVFHEVAKGTLDPEYQELALAYALDRPIDGMDDLLTDAIDTATDRDGRRALQQASEALRGKKLVIDRLRMTVSESTAPDGPVPSKVVVELANFDPTTQMLIAIPLLEEAGARLGERDREQLAFYAGLRKRRAQKPD